MLPTGSITAGPSPLRAPEARPARRCSFCGGRDVDGRRMCFGNSATICETCVAECDSELRRARLGRPGAPGRRLDPRDVFDRLGEFVVGQDEARKSIAIAVHNHRKRAIVRAGAPDAVEVEKSNILLVGPTGTGKTHLARSLSAVLDVPFCVVDVTGMTQAGYVGEDVESVVDRLVDAANGDTGAAAHGIVYLDEVDKLARSGSTGGAPDVGGSGVQQSLLKIVEGSARRGQGPGTAPRLDTSDVLFIAGGAFSGLLGSYSRRNGIGFRAPDAASTSLTFDDLVEYGLMAEFLGRFPVRVPLHPLSPDDLVRILGEPRNNILSQYVALFGVDGLDLRFDGSGSRAVAQHAFASGGGARALRTIIEQILRDAMFSIADADGETLLVDEHFVRDHIGSAASLIR